MDIIERMADNFLRTRYEDLPNEAVEATKKGVLDTLGVLIGGAAQCQKEVDLVREWGGKAESTIFVHGGKVPAVNAAWVNSSMAYALDYDGTGGIGPLHDLVCTVPTALAISEAQGEVSGKELITAIALGEDLAIRLNNAGRDYGGFSTVGIVMVFGTAAIAARILGLDIKGMLNALGIAFVRGAGSHQVATDKAVALRLLSAWSCRSGIEAAMLAQRGFTGVKNILQGCDGFYRLFTRDEPDLNILTDQLGKRFEVVRLQFKRYPSCGTTLAATVAAMTLARDLNIDSKGISRINVETAELTYGATGHPLTFGIGDVPDPVEGQFSQSYTVANAIVRGSSKLEHFTPKYMTDQEVIMLAKKVNPVVNKTGMEEISAYVEIEMIDGKKYSKLVTRNEIPIRKSAEEVKEKFRECVAFAPKFLPKENTEKIIEIVDNLEEIEKISELIELLRQ